MNDDVTVRAARVADAPGIARVLVDGWQTTYAGILPADFLASLTYDQHEAGTRQHLANLPESSAAIVAVRADVDIVGVAHVRESTESPGGCAAELDALYVSLWVLRDNPYRRFYERAGGIVLADEKHDQLGGVNVTSVAYGWSDIEALNAIPRRRS